MNYLEYSPIIDTGLIVLLAFIVWGAYRELRSRQVSTTQRKEA